MLAKYKAGKEGIPSIIALMVKVSFSILIYHLMMLLKNLKCNSNEI